METGSFIPKNNSICYQTNKLSIIFVFHFFSFIRNTTFRNVSIDLDLTSLFRNHEAICYAHLQIYTDWANHYLEKAKYKRTIADLQSDICDGVILADVIHAVSEYKQDLF